MRKLLLVAAALGALIGQDDAHAMSYGLTAIEDGRCTADCPLAIVARGRIDEQESERLLAFLQRVGSSTGIPRNFVVSSQGGDLKGALVLGTVLRQLGVRTVVGSVAPSPVGGRSILMPGVCGSACVFVLMAGIDRHVLPGSQVAVHSPQVIVSGQGQSFVLEGALSRRVIRRVEPVMHSYARQMGVDPAIVSLANRVPHETRHTLTPSELSRFRLVTRPAPQRATRTATWRPQRRQGGR